MTEEPPPISSLPVPLVVPVITTTRSLMSRVWSLMSGTLGIYIISLAWRSAVARKRNPLVREFISGSMFSVIYVFGVLVLMLQIAHALDIGVQQSVWWYLVGLTWLLMSVGYLFYFAIRGWVRAV